MCAEGWVLRGRARPVAKYLPLTRLQTLQPGCDCGAIKGTTKAPPPIMISVTVETSSPSSRLAAP